jgi:hypothetical protein
MYVASREATATPTTQVDSCSIPVVCGWSPECCLRPAAAVGKPHDAPAWGRSARRPPTVTVVQPRPPSSECHRLHEDPCDRQEGWRAAVMHSHAIREEPTGDPHPSERTRERGNANSTTPHGRSTHPSRSTPVVRTRASEIPTRSPGVHGARNRASGHVQRKRKRRNSGSLG